MNRLKTYNCLQCAETFQSARLLRFHKQCHHALRKPFRCNQCPEQFNREHNLNIHTASHIPAPTTCPECTIPFQRSAGYVGHLKSHMIGDDFHCKQCEKYFEFEKHYQQHLTTDHYQKDESADELHMRKSLNRTTEEPLQLYRKYRCNICNSKFTKASNLTRHKLIHSKTKRFECDKCSRKFTQKSTLDRHHKLHSGERNFECPKCSMRFSQQSNLKNHIRRLHPRNPDMTDKFPCPNCSCVFNKLNSLNRHSATFHLAKLSALGNAENDQEDDSQYSFERVMASLQNIALPSQSNSLFPTDNSRTPALGALVNTKEPSTDSVAEDVGFVKIIETMNGDEEKSEVVVKQVQGEDGRKYYRCSTCSKEFPRPFELLRHSRIHTNEKPFQCKICGRCFSIKSNLQAHQRVHEKRDCASNAYTCPECLQQFSSIRQLDSHVITHGTSKLFTCEICKNAFRTMNNLRKHEHVHRPKHVEELKLQETLKQLLSASGTSSISRSLKPQRIFKSQCNPQSSVKPFKCFTCQTRFTAKRSLNTHQKIHSGHKTKQCDQCNAKFRSNTELKRHRTSHSTLRPYFCPYCPKSYKTRETCRIHIRTHAKQIVQEEDRISPEPNTTTQNNIILPEIGSEETVQSVESVSQITTTGSYSIKKSAKDTAIFIRLDDLIHRNRKRTAPRTITVQHVEKTSSLVLECSAVPSVPPQTLLQTTSPTGKHQCETCGRAFKKPIDLRRHQRTHTQERPFTCDICNVSFKLKCTLDTHRLVHDTNRSKFDCQVCGKSYASQDVLKVHLRLHTNERPYKCDFCDKVFRTTGHRDAHMRVHVSVPKDKRSKQKKFDVKRSEK